MTDINKLVEDYFAPRSKALTNQMLYEMFDEVLGEQEQEIDPFDSFALDSSLTNKEIGSILLGKIKETSNLPQDAVWHLCTPPRVSAMPSVPTALHRKHGCRPERHPPHRHSTSLLTHSRSACE